MTERRVSFFILLTTLLSSCAVRTTHTASFEIHERWMIINGEKAGEKVIILKNTNDLILLKLQN